jgi:hypothetical protein
MKFRTAACVIALGSAIGCGSNAPDLPPELIDAIKSGRDTDAGAYPPGPYGSREGEIAQNLCFEGWRNPVAAGFDPAALETLCFSDFYDPTGAEVEIVLVNTGAVWCTACKTEWGGSATRPSLSEHQARLDSQGFRVFGIFFQDAAGDPADVEVIRSWAQAFSIGVPFAMDPDFLMDTFADALVQPFNMLLDARTMTILLAVPGDNPEVLFARVEQELADRAAR